MARRVGDNMKNKIKKYSLNIEGKIRPVLRNAKTGKIKWIGEWNHNIIPNVGLAAVARRYGNVGTKSNEGAVTYGAVGKGSIVPAATDTIMEDEIERKLIATKTITNQTTHLEAFFAEDEANDDITKFALFGEEATGAADSGTMMEYADFEVPFTKTAIETLTVEIDITVSDT